MEWIWENISIPVGRLILEDRCGQVYFSGSDDSASTRMEYRIRSQQKGEVI